MRVGGRERRVRSGVGGSERGAAEAGVVGKMRVFPPLSRSSCEKDGATGWQAGRADREHTQIVGEPSMGATRAGIAGDGSAATGRRVCGDCDGPGRYGAGAGDEDSAGDVVPLQAGGGEDAVQPWSVLGTRGYAQSAAAVVLECAARRVEPGGGMVLRGFEFQVRRERERQAPIEITTRKPPAATWQANAAWDQEKRA